MKNRGPIIIALAMMLLVLSFAGAGLCQSPSAPSNVYKGHKECNPLCFVKCAVDGGDLFCYANCLKECLFPPTGEPDPDDPQATCMANCAVPACAKLSTKANPFSQEVELCLESCAGGCAEKKKIDNQHQYQPNH